jgi:dephospho-CoA kinase
VLKVGLTGGIGSGKSEVARLLRACGAVVVDADAIAREVVEPGTPGLAAVVDEFGRDVLRPDGSLDRQRLAGIVFSDPERLAALNAIVHPLVGERSVALMADAPPDAIVVYEVPLLVENDLAGLYDLVVVVDAPDATRIDRLVRLRRMTADDVRARITAQADRERRLAAADVVVDNGGSPEALERQVRELWTSLRALARSAGGPADSSADGSADG